MNGAERHLQLTLLSMEPYSYIASSSQQLGMRQEGKATRRIRIEGGESVTCYHSK